MADTPSISPTSSSSITPTTNTAGAAGSAEVGAVNPVKASKLVDLIVRQLPLTLKIGAEGKTLKGIAVKNNPQLEEVIIKTAEGEIKVKSSVRLEPNTEVIIKVFNHDKQNHADIIISKQTEPSKNNETNIKTSKALLEPVAIKQSMVLPASILPEVEKAELDKAINIIQNIKKENLLKIPLDISPETLKKLKATNNIKKTLETLPPLEKKLLVKSIINEFLSGKHEAVNKENMHKMQEAYKPHNIEIEKSVPKYDIRTSDTDLVKLIHTEIKIKKADAIIPNNIIKEVIDIESETTPERKLLKAEFSKEAGLITNKTEINKTLPIESFTIKKETPIASKIEYSKPQKNAEKNYKVEVLKILTQGSTNVDIDIAIKNEAKKIPPVLGKNPKNEIYIAKLESTSKEGFPILKAKNAASGTTEHFIIKKPLIIKPETTIIIKATAIVTTPTEGIYKTSKEFLSEQVPLPIFPTMHSSNLENFLPFASPKWPALEQSLKILENTVPQTAQIIKASLPTPGKSFAPTVLFFLAALRFGSIESWLGENTLKALRNSGKKDLIDRLSQDFGKLSTHSKDSASNEWRAVSIPLLHDEQLEQIQLFTRQHHEDDRKDNEDNKKISRFILNLRLSHIGKMQLDGLIRNKKFDIIIRSEEKLALNIRQEIMARFSQGLAQVNMQGGASFQAEKTSWVNIELEKDDNIIA